jgi:hypothetical protein
LLHGWDAVSRTVTDPRRLGMLLEQSRLALALFNLLAVFVALRTYCWFFHAAIHASADESLGVRAALARAKHRGYGFLLLFVVQQVIVQLGMLLFIVPGIILAVLFGFALWSFARDESGVFEALSDSVRMVKGRFLGVLGRMLLTGLVALPFMLVPVVGWLVGAAWVMGAWSLLYTDLTRRVPAKSPAVAIGTLRPRRATAS